MFSSIAENLILPLSFCESAEVVILSLDAICLSGNLYDYVSFAMNSGLRLGEQLNLSLDRVDLKNSEIYIIETKTKTNTTIPINPVLLDIINKRKNKSNEIFALPKGTLHFRWVNALKKANIKDFRWHDLRHTFASWCIKGVV